MSSNYTHSSKRVYYRRALHREGWGWAGWLPLIGLLAVFGYGVVQTAPAIEAATAAEVRDSLAGFGLEDFEVEANGQSVMVRAAGPQSRADEIDAWAASSACDTWIAGEQICPLDVRVQMSGVPEPTTAPVAAEPAAPVRRFHDFSFSESDGVLTLTGEVPSEATRQAILATARQNYATVNDSLSVSGEAPTDGFDWAVDRVWPTLSALNDGVIAWQYGQFSVSGEVVGASVEDVRRSLATAAFSERLGDLSLSAPPLADVCTDRFADSLSRSMIQFRTGSADIAPASAALLEELAAIARGCPMALTIEGHTDSSGPAAFNDFLSLERARAVVAALAAAGIDSSRLSAEGFGANRPIGDNATAAGRALNRRIEIKAVETLGGEQ